MLPEHHHSAVTSTARLVNHWWPFHQASHHVHHSDSLHSSRRLHVAHNRNGLLVARRRCSRTAATTYAHEESNQIIDTGIVKSRSIILVLPANIAPPHPHTHPHPSACQSLSCGWDGEVRRYERYARSSATPLISRLRYSPDLNRGRPPPRARLASARVPLFYPFSKVMPDKS